MLLSVSRPDSGRPLVGLGVTVCATARLRACPSRRSALNSSSRIGFRLTQGEAGDTRPNTKRVSDIMML